MEGMDMLQGVRDGVEGGEGMPPLGEDFAMPSIEQMLEALEKMDMSDEDKETLKQTLTGQGLGGLGDLGGMMGGMGDNMMADFFKPAFEILPSGNPWMQYVLAVAFLIVLTMFVFFGYKLYRSLTEKERKRDEKRKQKQLKKKK